MDNLLILGAIGVMTFLGVLFTILFMLLLRQRQANRPNRRGPAQDDEAATRQRTRVAVIWPEEGKPLVWIVDGRRYTHPEEVIEPEAQALLAHFFQILPSSYQAPAPVPAPQRLSASDTAPNPALRPTAPAAAAPVAPVPPAAGRAQPPTRRRTYEEELEQPLVERLKSSFFSNRAPTKPSTGEILDRLERPAIPQLDELDQHLQARLIALPTAPTATIRHGSSGLLEIVVAGQVYERIDDVPDPAVRSAMRDAVRAWESGIA